MTSNFDNSVTQYLVGQGYTFDKPILVPSNNVVQIVIKNDVKLVVKQLNLSQQTQEVVNREIAMYSENIKHDYIGVVIDVQQVGAFVLVIQPYYPDSLQSVLEYRKAKKPIDNFEQRFAKWMNQLIEVVTFIHEDLKSIYRDLKPQNIMIDEKDDIKLIDFGTMRKYSQEIANLTMGVGTVNYIAPEVFSDEDYNERVDYFSLACVLLSVFQGEQTQSKKIQPTIPKDWPQNLQNVVSGLLNKDPDQRPTLKALQVEINQYFNYFKLPKLNDEAPQRTSNVPVNVPKQTRRVVRNDFVFTLHFALIQDVLTNGVK